MILAFTVFILDIIKVSIVFPLVVLFHELGHALAVLLCKGEVTKIEIGRGKKWLVFKKFSVSWNLTRGRCYWDDSAHHKLTVNEKIFICAGGVLLNYLIAILLFLSTVDFFSIIKHFASLVPLNFMEAYAFALLFEVVNLIPFTGSDGEQIKKLYQSKSAKKAKVH